MANTCRRCGLPKFDWRATEITPGPTCGATEDSADRLLVKCRDRELSALRAEHAATLALLTWAQQPGRQVWCGGNEPFYAHEDGKPLRSGESAVKLLALLEGKAGGE